MYNLLKLNQDGSFDENYSLDLSEILPFTFIWGATFVYDDKFAIAYIDSADFEFPAAYGDRFEVWENSDVVKSVIIDLETQEITPFTGFEGWSGAFLLNTIDGVNYYSANSASGISGLLRQDGANTMTQLSTHNGGSNFRAVDKLW